MEKETMTKFEFKSSGKTFFLFLLAILLTAAWMLFPKSGDAQNAPRAFIDGVGPGWRTLTENDFVDVNGDPETWEWHDGLIVTTGKPIGVYRKWQRGIRGARQTGRWLKSRI